MGSGFGQLDERTPVLIAVGTAHHRVSPDSSQTAGTDVIDALAMMELAARSALGQAVSTSRLAQLLRSISLVAVPEGDWKFENPARAIATRLGCESARTVRVEIGVPQHAPIRAALLGIQSGQMQAALIVGGEAKATQLRIERAGGIAPGTSPDGAGLDGAAREGAAREGAEPDERWTPEGEIMAEAEIAAGIWSAVEQYACIDAALRYSEGQSVPDHLDSIASLWQQFNQIASQNPDAAFGTPRSAEFLRAAGPGNRPLAFPYAKWHSTQWAVDQAAAMVLCSVGLARELGVPTDQWVFPRVALESSLSVSLTKRAEMGRWPAMKVLGDAAAAHLQQPLNHMKYAEVYSCFPAAVRVQQRELGLAQDQAPTLTGGMAFAGGPFNNFTYQATAAVVDRLREDPGSLGMVTTVSGLLTKPALAVWSTEPGEVLIADLVAEATLATAVREVTNQGSGLANIASYTVTYTGTDPSSAFVIADLADGRRWIGTSTDSDLLSEGVTAELIGRQVIITGNTCEFAD
jgi:acetyl-CoA C-acetyltransferase